MLTPGNKKLGGHLIWGFGLPSDTAALCPGMTPTCKRVCYAVRLQQYRPQALRLYRRNLRLVRRKDFVKRVRAFLCSQGVRVVRIHTSGEFVTPKYVRKWLRIIAKSTKVKFFTYTRVWQLPEFAEVLAELSQLPNLSLWYSCDRDTGLPEVVPPRVRLAWLMTSAEDVPPPGVDLVFRTTALRRQPAEAVNGITVCPAENGSTPSTTCDRCRMCWRPAVSRRVPLPSIPS
jgi:hypothetical protein